ncbi:e3 ubiquitin-protein ligase RNF13 [Trichonephila clavipes]|nr:e3 ubiquitin-protein ligase RNF13 [Trichonephila clavipes]
METHTITPPVGAVCCYKAKSGLGCSPQGLHTRTPLSSLVRFNLDSSLKTTWYHSGTVHFTLAGHHSKRRPRWVALRAAHVMGAAIQIVLQPGTFVRIEKTLGLLVKVLPVPGWRTMKKLAVRVHLLRSGSLLDDLSVDGILSLVFM